MRDATITAIETTKSICPVCHRVIDAYLYEDGGALYISKNCPEHGRFKDLYWSDYQLYRRFKRYDVRVRARAESRVDGRSSNRSRREFNPSCPFACGLCTAHESHTVLGIIDVTSRCNLRCPVCFAGNFNDDYGGGRSIAKEPTAEEIRAIIDNFATNTNAAGIQFSGGEPTLRDDLPELISYARQRFEHVEVDTNGIKMAESEEYCRAIESAGTSVVYLQFDGVTDAPYEKLRGRKLLEVKKRAIENHRRAGPKPAIVLVPTVVKGVNDDQIGDIIKFAIENRDIIRGVNFQPISFCGRAPYRASERITVSDVLRGIEEQTGLLTRNDFFPPSLISMVLTSIGKSEVGCHFACGAFSYLVIKDGKAEPITRYMDMEKLAEIYRAKGRITPVAALRHIKLGFLKNLFVSVLRSHAYRDLSSLHFNLIFIGTMHFMDAYNFDLARVKRCVIHYGLPDGRIVPFCSYNNIHRP